MPVPNIFTNGDPVEAAKVNENFANVLTQIQEAVEGASGELEADITNLNNQYQQTKNKVNALDNNTVKLTGTQTTTGNKTFSGDVTFSGNVNINLNWVQKNRSISIGTTNLNDANNRYLPNDGHKYLVWVSGAIHADGTDTSIKINTDIMTTARSFMRLDADAGRSSFANNFVVVPVGTGRTLTLTRSGPAPSESSFYVFGYMRI